VLEDHELTASRVERIEQLRGRIRAKVKATGPSHVYIGRGFTGSTRSLQNEAEVVATLEARGFAFVSPESSSPREICDALANARVIASIEGSAMTHALLASPRGATLVAITPPWRMNAWLKSYADVLGMRYAVAVGDGAGEGCFTQPIDRLERLLDLVEQTAPA
jgi:capsular polysaccharide biosynthesis protein